MTRKVTICVQHLEGAEQGLPMTLDFITANLDRDIQADLKEAES